MLLFRGTDLRKGLLFGGTAKSYGQLDGVVKRLTEEGKRWRKSTGTRVSVSGKDRIVSDGPFAESGNNWRLFLLDVSHDR
jgi:hypothetical protein